MIQAIAEALCAEFNIEDRSRVLAILTQKPDYKPLEEIADLVCEEFGITLEQLKPNSPKEHYSGGRSRLPFYVDARVQFAKFARFNYQYSLHTIATFLGCDHSTVTHWSLHRKSYTPKYEGFYTQDKRRPRGRPKKEKEEAPVVKLERPKAEYTNLKSGYL